jgi:1,4-dihydroxy-6-naphthoate synthase
LLDAGSALGFGCGPLLIAQSPIDESAVNEGPVAIPGELTTAHFLLNLAYPKIKNKVVHIFSDIEEKVLDGTVQAGLIIHENRFTYAAKGLVKLIDLGQFWEDKFNLPIPLGGIFCKRSFSPDLALKINRVIRRSVEYAFSNPESPRAYIQAHAQEMDPEVQQKHIDLYVNAFSVDLGEQGRQAIQHLFDFGRNQGIIQQSEKPIFLKYSE